MVCFRKSLLSMFMSCLMIFGISVSASATIKYDAFMSFRGDDESKEIHGNIIVDGNNNVRFDTKKTISGFFKSEVQTLSGRVEEISEEKKIVINFDRGSKVGNFGNWAVYKKSGNEWVNDPCTGPFTGKKVVLDKVSKDFFATLCDFRTIKITAEERNDLIVSQFSTVHEESRIAKLTRTEGNESLNEEQKKLLTFLFAMLWIVYYCRNNIFAESIYLNSCAPC